MARKRKKKAKGTQTDDRTEGQAAEQEQRPEPPPFPPPAPDEQARYDSVSVTGSGRDVTAEEPTEAFTEPQPEAPTVDPWEFDPFKKLGDDAPNFTHREVAKSSTADRYGIDNTPSPQVLRAAHALAVNCLQPMRAEFGKFAPQSWYRGEALERIVAKQGFVNWCHRHTKPSDTDSWDEYFARKSHPKGMAADCEIIGVPNDELYQWCLANLQFDQLIREFPKEGDPMSGWVHISYNATANRGEAFTIG